MKFFYMLGSELSILRVKKNLKSQSQISSGKKKKERKGRGRLEEQLNLIKKYFSNSLRVLRRSIRNLPIQ